MMPRALLCGRRLLIACYETCSFDGTACSGRQVQHSPATIAIQQRMMNAEHLFLITAQRSSSVHLPLLADCSCFCRRNQRCSRTQVELQ
jgi:hypothetical protein